jgi:hypothetical protein
LIHNSSKVVGSINTSEIGPVVNDGDLPFIVTWQAEYPPNDREYERGPVGTRQHAAALPRLADLRNSYCVGITDLP